MTPSSKCLDLIKRFEGCRLKAYPDPASPRAADPSNPALSGSPWTIGYGHTGPDVYEGLVISPEEASRLLQERVSALGGMLVRLFPMGLTQGQLDALTSFCYNVGMAAFRGSTLVRLLNGKPEDRLQRAADELLKWDKAGGREIAGLKARRQAERELFLS